MSPMPRRANSFWPILLGLPLGLLAVATAYEAVWLPWYYRSALQDNPTFRLAFETEGVHGLVIFLAVACAVGSALFLIGSVTALLRRGPWALALVRKCY